MPEKTQNLTSSFRRRAYGDLILETQKRWGDEALAAQTYDLLEGVRPAVRKHADEVYRQFFKASKSGADFFDGPTAARVTDIAHTIKGHYMREHKMLLTQDEAERLAHVVTLNYARLCNLNHGFKEHLKNSRTRGPFRRLFR